MIKSFGNRDTEKIWNGEKTRAYPTSVQGRAVERMLILNAVVEIEDLYFPPSNGFHALSGKLSGFHSLKINRQWRLIFRWVEENAHNVEIIDYH